MRFKKKFLDFCILGLAAFLIFMIMDNGKQTNAYISDTIVKKAEQPAPVESVDEVEKMEFIGPPPPTSPDNYWIAGILAVAIF